MRSTRGILLLATLVAACSGDEEALLPPPDSDVSLVPITTSINQPRVPRYPPRRATPPPPWAGRHDFKVTLGKRTETGDFVAFNDGDEVPVVLGSQALVHLEIDFKAWPADVEIDRSIQVWAVGTTRVNCGSLVEGYYVSKRLIVYPPSDAQGGFWPASPAVLIFDRPYATPYVDRDCCVALHIGLWVDGYALPAAWGTGERRLRCVKGTL